MGKKSLPVVQETKSDDITSSNRPMMKLQDLLRRLLEMTMSNNPQRPNMLKTENILAEEDKDLPEVG